MILRPKEKPRHGCRKSLGFGGTRKILVFETGSREKTGLGVSIVRCGMQFRPG